MKKALLVGINYKGTQHSLSGCINDMVKMQEVLKRDYGFTRVTLLTDDTASKPTKANIVAHLRSLITMSRADDQLFFMFSGHGTQVRDTGGDERDGLDEALYTLDNMLITDDELHALLANSRAPVTVVMDCCHSGTMCDLEFNVRPPQADATTHTLSMEQPKAVPAKVCLLSGCLDEQYAADAWFRRADNEYESNGAFTYCLLEVLREGGYKVSYKRLLSALSAKLKGYGYDQVPQLSCSRIDTFGQDFLA